MRSIDTDTIYLGHEAGHGTLSSYDWVNHVVGFVLHTVGQGDSMQSDGTDRAVFASFYWFRITRGALHINYTM